MSFKSLIQEPFVQFLLLGSFVFFLFSLVGGGEELIDRDVHVSQSDITRLSTLWETQYARPPVRSELASVIDQHIREEIFFREAMALGLAEDDVIVRRRLVQKYQFLSEDRIVTPDPGDEVLADWFDNNRELYRRTSKTSFSHVYLSAESRGEKARSDAAVMMGNLRRSDDDWRTQGDPFMLQKEFAARDDREISDLFGAGFARDIAALDDGIWAGPVRSAYGWHVVKILRRTPQEIPQLAEIRDEVLADYKAVKKEDISRQTYEALKARYDISIAVSPTSHQEQ